MEINPAKEIKHFGKNYVLQVSSTNPETIKTAENIWKNIGHSVLHKTDVNNKELKHLYVSQFKTRNY